MRSFISAIGTANPRHKYAQQDILKFMTKMQQPLNGTPVKQAALYRATGIKYRYSVLEDYSADQGDFTFYPNTENLEPFPDTARRMQYYQKEALDLAEKSILDCFDKLPEFDVRSITHLITVSCTGFYAPGLDIELINKLGLDTHIHRTAINYMGCYAAITALRNADSVVKSNPEANVLIVCLELCSLHYQKNDSLDNQLANALFGDGAAALLITSTAQPTIQLKPVKFRSNILPQGSEDMAWTIGNLGFEMRLSSYVPEIIKGGIGQLCEELLQKSNGIPLLSDIKYFAIHPGGKKILKAVENELNISRDQNKHAYEVLKNFGNMSSPTILFVLNELHKTLTPSDQGEFIFCMAFGPGLTLESTLLEIVV